MLEHTKYLWFVGVIELWLKIMQIGCAAIKAHSRFMCGSVYTESFIYPPWPIPVVSVVSVSCYNEPATLCSVYIPTRHTGYDRCSTRCSTTLVMESVDLTWR